MTSTSASASCHLLFICRRVKIVFPHDLKVAGLEDIAEITAGQEIRLAIELFLENSPSKFLACEREDVTV